MKEYTLKINGNVYDVAIVSRTEDIAEVSVNGTMYEVELGGMEVKPTVLKTPQVAAIPATHPVQPSAVAMPAAKPGSHGGGGHVGAANAVKSPLPGVILDIKVREGDRVEIGTPLAILEAMKMENNIESDRSGVVKSVKVHRGDSVLEGDILIVIE